MQLTRIRLFEFRNYHEVELCPHPNITVLAGQNAQGKTNVVEAVLLCATAASFRAGKDDEFINWGERAAYVGVEFTKAKQNRKVEIKFRKDGRRAIRLDSQPLSRSGDLIGELCAVMFSPEDLKLIKEGPAARRRFMNIGVSQLNKGYFLCLVEYSRILKQRNALLREISVKRRSENELDIWDESLAKAAGELTKTREWYIKELSGIAAARHRELSGGEELELRYKPSIQGDTAGEKSKNMKEKLLVNRKEDIKRLTTGIGPHHDDIIARIDGIDARSFGSQGQQRTAALAIKLAELGLIERITGETPILLLDDVLSELDENRQERLFDMLSGAQTILTCASMSGIRKDAGMDVYTVTAGTLCKAK